MLASSHLPAGNAAGTKTVARRAFHNIEDPEQILLLLEKSKFPWAVPGLPLGLVNFDNPCFMNTDNPRLATSQPESLTFQHSRYRVHNSGCFVESLLRLAARSRGEAWTYQECWIRELNWLMFKYIKGGKRFRNCQVDSLLWPSVRQLLHVEEGERFLEKLDLVL